MSISLQNKQYQSSSNEMKLQNKRLTWTLGCHGSGGGGKVRQVDGDVVVAAVEVEELGPDEHEVQVLHIIVRSACADHLGRQVT